MRKHVESGTLTSTCSTALRLMRSEDNVHSLVKANVLDALHHLYATQEESVTVMEAATECAAAIARHPYHSHLLLDSSVAQDVLTALHHYPENERIVQAGLATFNSLIGGKQGGGAASGATSPVVSPRGKGVKDAVVGMSGLIDTLITAIESHPDNDALLDAGAECLRALSDGDDLRLLLSVNPGNNAATASAVSKLSSLLLVESNVDVVMKAKGVEWIMRAMRAAQQATADGDATVHTAHILTSASRALQRLCVDEASIYALMTQGAVKALITLLNTHSAHHDVVTSAMKALSCMTTREDSAFYIAKAGAVRAMKGVAAAHPVSDKVAARIAELNGRLCGYDKCVDVQVKEGVVMGMVDLINRRTQQQCNADTAKRVLLSSTHVLTRLAKHDGVRKDVITGVSVSAVTSILRMNPKDEELTLRAVEFLTAAAASPAGLGVIREEEVGVEQAVLGCMDVQKGNVGVQAACTALLATLTPSDASTASTTITAALTSTSSLTAAGPASLDALLSNVKAVSHLSLMDANAGALIEAGAVKRLVEAFDAAARMQGGGVMAGVRAGVMSSAAGTVHRLMKEKEVDVCKSIVVGGMMAAMVSSAVSEGSEEVSENVTPLIAVLACDTAVAHGMMEDGTMQGMLTLAKQHHLNSSIIHDTTTAIGLVVQDVSHVSAIVEWGSAEVLVDSLLTHHADLTRTQHTLAVINTLSSQPAAVPSFLSMDSIAAILEIIKVHSAQPDILTLAMQCLAHLLVNDEAAEEVGQLNGCALLVKAMREHYTQEGLCEIDMILLDSLSSHPTNVEQLLEPDLATVELVKWVANKYAKNQTLVDAGHRLLSALDVKKEGTEALLELSFDSTQCDLILSRLRNPNIDQQDALSLLNSLAALVNTAEKADVLAVKGGVSLLAGCVNRSVKDERMWAASVGAMLRVCEYAGEGVVGELSKAEVVQAMVGVVNSERLGFATKVSVGDLTAAVTCMGRMKMKDGVVQQILQHNPLPTLLSHIYSSNDPALLPASTRLISKLTNHDDASTHIARITNLRELIQAMRKQAQERGALAEDFLKYGVYLLGNLAANDERVKEEVGIEGGIQVIIFIMNIAQLKAKAAFIEYCTLALANLSLQSPNNAAFIVASKGVQLLLQLIALHVRAEELLDNAICVLCNVCYRNDSNKELIIQLDGAPTLVSAALANFSAVSVLLSTFRTLGNLAYNAASTVAIIGAGAVQGLVAGMSIHGGSVELILLCLRVLTNLSSEYCEANMRVMKEEGAVQAVVEVCHLHAGKEKEAEVVNATLLCLCNLGRYYPNAALIVLQGLCTDLHLAITTHIANATLVTSASRLLNILAHTHPTDLDRILDAAAPAAIYTALTAHPRVKPIFTNLTAALTLLSYNSESAADIGASGVVESVVGIVRAHADDATYYVDAFPALSALCRDEGCAARMAEASFGFLAHVLSVSGSEHRMALHTFAFLSNLCVHASAAQPIVHTRVLPLAFASLHAHVNLPDVLLRGLRFLENLCYTGDAVKRYLLTHQLETEVLSVMNANLRHEDVKKACQAILDALNAHAVDFAAMPNPSLTPFKDIEIKSARQLFGDEHKEACSVMPDHIRNFLISGQLLVKHSKTAPPRPRHVYCTADLKWLVWKDPKKPLHPDNKMKTWKLRGVERGRCTQQLQRKRFGKWLCREEGGFAIVGRERNVDLEAESEKEREKWVEAITALVAYRKHLKKNASQFDKDGGEAEKTLA